ncbi:MAG: molecular chaperone [Oceanospirillaceae bacterium]|nr:molecular chaperone [Oceanospirillaceae bacterium]
MISGFDYGTSNCAIGIINADSSTTSLLPLEQQHNFLPSTVYALGRELICEQVARQIPDASIRSLYVKSRAAGLNRASKFRREESIGAKEQSLYFGREAFSQYFSLPGEGYFVKSAKSFLGASGVRAEFIHFFEDIVTVMMQQIKQRAEQQCQQQLTHTVIGRPVNFQGINAAKSNSQALDILKVSAERAGFKSVEFLYEPIAAGLDFEKQLTVDKKVLVVDIGGGTSDCAMVQMGPGHRHRDDRTADFIGHSGERIGGNDFDIQLAANCLMPLMGMKSVLKNGLPMPTQTFWNAVATNDVGAQAQFNKLETSLLLQQLLRDTSEPQLLQRFLKLRDNRQNQQVVSSAEQTKIKLSTVSQSLVELDYIEDSLSCQVSFAQMRHAVQRPLKKMINLMGETIKQAGSLPDLIYITGGSAKSPLIREAIEQRLGNIEVVDGDHFGSVANGLTLWAQRIYS